MKYFSMAAAALYLSSSMAFGAGLYESYPAATALTGVEEFGADSKLPQGIAPQTFKVTFNQIKNFVFGNTASGTATSSGGLATINAGRGIVTTESLTTPAGAIFNLSVDNSTVTTGSIVLVSVGNGTNTVVGPTLAGVRTAPGAFYMDIRNTHATDAFNGTLKVSFIVIN